MINLVKNNTRIIVKTNNIAFIPAIITNHTSFVSRGNSADIYRNINTAYYGKMVRVIEDTVDNGKIRQIVS